MKPFAFVASALFVALAPGQSEPAHPAEKATPAKAPFVFEAGTVELRALIARCGAYLQRNILVDDAELMSPKAARPRAAQGAVGPAGAAPQPAADGPSGPVVELQMPIVTDRNGCEEMLASLLWTRGLALVPLDEAKNVYEVISMSGPRAREITMRAATRTPEQALARPALRQCVVVLVPLENVNANVATNALRPFFANSGGQGAMTLSIGTVGATTSMLLLGPQDQVAAAIQLIRAADVPQPPDARPEITQRLDALTQQNAQLAQRLAALEEKLKQKS